MRHCFTKWMGVVLLMALVPAGSSFRAVANNETKSDPPQRVERDGNASGGEQASPRERGNSSFDRMSPPLGEMFPMLRVTTRTASRSDFAICAGGTWCSSFGCLACPPSSETFPVMEAVERDYRGRGLTIHQENELIRIKDYDAGWIQRYAGCSQGRAGSRTIRSAGPWVELFKPSISSVSLAAACRDVPNPSHILAGRSFFLSLQPATKSGFASFASNGTRFAKRRDVSFCGRMGVPRPRSRERRVNRHAKS